MNAIEILRTASRSVPNEDYVQFCEAVDGIAELIEAARAAEFHLTREHRAPMTVDAADYLTEVERDRNRIGSLRSRIVWECWEIQQARLWRNRMVRADVYADNHGAHHPAGSYRLHLQSFLPCAHG